MISIGDQPAFPTEELGIGPASQGMTYRQWLVGKALQGLMAGADNLTPSRATEPDVYSAPPIIADLAVKYADAIIVELEQSE